MLLGLADVALRTRYLPIEVTGYLDAVDALTGGSSELRQWAAVRRGELSLRQRKLDAASSSYEQVGHDPSASLAALSSAQLGLAQVAAAQGDEDGALVRRFSESRPNKRIEGYMRVYAHAVPQIAGKTADEVVADAFDQVADEIARSAGIDIGFLLDVIPGAETEYTLTPAAGIALEKADSVLGLAGFISEIWSGEIIMSEAPIRSAAVRATIQSHPRARRRTSSIGARATTHTESTPPTFARVARQSSARNETMTHRVEQAGSAARRFSLLEVSTDGRLL